eukprot:gene40434-54682_t
MTLLAHISDVHLAPMPPVKWTELLNKRITGYLNWRFRRQATLSGEGLTNLVRHMREQTPDFVAVTGDLVNLGLEPEANTAWNWLQTVGPTETVCVSPGNHDSYLKPSFGFNNDRWGDYMRGETLDAAQFPFVRRVGDIAVISCTSSVTSPPGFALGDNNIGEIAFDGLYGVAPNYRLMADYAERIEVLKGPQGTLYGRNSTGGTINYIANKPTKTFTAGAEVTGGSYGRLDTEGFISGPITDNLRVRLAGSMSESQTGWQTSNTRPDDRLGKVSKRAARGTLRGLAQHRAARP